MNAPEFANTVAQNVQHAYGYAPPTPLWAYALVIWIAVIPFILLSVSLSPFRPTGASDEAEFVVDAATVIFWPLILLVLAIATPVGLWYGAKYIGTGIADLWALRPKRETKPATLPKMTAVVRK